MPTRVVIAIDTKQRTMDALALGKVLVSSTGAPAALLTVFPYHPLSDPDAPEMVSIREEAGETLAALARDMDFEDAATEVVAGNFAARELQHVTERPDAGLLVVGSTTRGTLGRLLIGGVGERLLAGAACPVAIAPRGYADGAPSRLTRIGVGTDGSAEARHALDAAVVLAQRAGAEVRVITAFQSLAFGAVSTGALSGASANDTMRMKLREIHDEAVRAASATVAAEGRFLDGPADEVLVDESRDLDLLVVGSRGYGPLGSVLLGSASTALARGAACPVLVTPRATRLDLLD